MSTADRLKSEIAAREAPLVSLTQDLIRIPTRNPPGENYREICDYLDRRLLRAGFHTELIRAEGAIGDSDRHPRWNLVARREDAILGVRWVLTEYGLSVAENDATNQRLWDLYREVAPLLGFALVPEERHRDIRAILPPEEITALEELLGSAKGEPRVRN